jgi:hypothetical protein
MQTNQATACTAYYLKLHLTSPSNSNTPYYYTIYHVPPLVQLHWPARLHTWNTTTNITHCSHPYCTYLLHHATTPGYILHYCTHIPHIPYSVPHLVPPIQHLPPTVPVILHLLPTVPPILHLPPMTYRPPRLHTTLLCTHTIVSTTHTGPTTTHSTSDTAPPTYSTTHTAPTTHDMTLPPMTCRPPRLHTTLLYTHTTLSITHTGPTTHSTSDTAPPTYSTTPTIGTCHLPPTWLHYQWHADPPGYILPYRRLILDLVPPILDLLPTVAVIGHHISSTFFFLLIYISYFM